MNKATKLVILSGIVVGIGLAMTSKHDSKISEEVAAPSKAVTTMPALKVVEESPNSKQEAVAPSKAVTTLPELENHTAKVVEEPSVESVPSKSVVVSEGVDNK